MNTPERVVLWRGENLRRCPLCGGRVRFTGASLLGGLLNNLGIECSVCGMETRSGQFEHEDELRDFWNGKPQMTEEEVKGR